jgi:hypothetical protein
MPDGQAAGKPRAPHAKTEDRARVKALRQVGGVRRSRSTAKEREGLANIVASTVPEEAVEWSEENVGRLLGFCDRGQMAMAGGGARGHDEGGGPLSMEELGALLAVRGRERYGEGYRAAVEAMSAQMDRREQHVRREVLAGALLMVKTELEAFLKEYAGARRPGRGAAAIEDARREAVQGLVAFTAEVSKTQRRVQSGEVSV